MKRFLYILLFLIGCSPKSEQSVQFRELDIDFPTSETLPEEVIGNYELYGCRSMLVKDSLLFVKENGSQDNFGRCFNITTGEVINTLVRKGRASDEMVNIDDYLFLGDSLQAISGNFPKCLKLYSIHDILNGNKSTPREITIPDTLKSFSFGMIDNHTMFGIQSQLSDANDAKYFLFNGDKLKDVEKIREELVKTNLEPTNSDLRSALNSMFIRHKDKLIIATSSALQIEILNLKNNLTDAKCYYNAAEIMVEKEQGCVMIQSKRERYIKSIGCTNESIYAFIEIVIDEENADNFVLKFDWELKPIAKYAIKGRNYKSTFSENCDYLYTFTTSENGESEILKRYKL